MPDLFFQNLQKKRPKTANKIAEKSQAQLKRLKKGQTSINKAKFIK